MRQNWRPHLHWRILRPTRAVSQSWSWLGTLSVPFHHYDNRQLLLYIARKSSWHLSARNIGEKFTKNTTTSTKKSLFVWMSTEREKNTPERVKTSILAFKKGLKGEVLGPVPLSKEIPKPELAAVRHGSSLPPEELAWKAAPPIWPGPFQKLPTEGAWRLRNKHLCWVPENGFLYISLNKEKITEGMFPYSFLMLLEASFQLHNRQLRAWDFLWQL